MSSSSSSTSDLLLLLSCWTPITTRLLQTGNSSAWHVMDNAMPDDEQQQHDNNDHFFDKQLYQELQAAKLFDKLLPARTQGDVQTDDILALLQQLQLPSSSSSSSSTTMNIRGDKSLFLSREYRSHPDFGTRHPNLHRLISSVTATVTQKMAHCIQFDTTAMTSVQLAVYPGDGKSGYRRHCDRGQDSCRDEEKTTTKASSQQQQSSSSSSSPKRIVTAIYYLTPNDWSDVEDGGCLRLFARNNHNNTHTHTDVAPYRNRLIVFRSDGVEHQVLPSLRRPRTAITIWFYGTLKDQQQRKKKQQVEWQEEEESSRTTIGETSTSVGGGDSSSSKNNNNDNNKNNDDSVGVPLHETFQGPPPLLLPTRISMENNSIGENNNNNNNNNNLPTIFVSIASYRDSETAPTLSSLFSTARYPHRIFVGLVLQLDDDDDDDDELSNDDGSIWKAVRSSRYFKNHQVRCLRMDARDATGPCYARALCQSLHRGEPYVMQVDSHMRFRQNWDDYLIRLLQDTQRNHQTETILLTAYPVGYQLPNQIPNETRGTVLVPWKFDDTGMLRQRGRLLKRRTTITTTTTTTEAATAEAIPCHLYAGGFNFGPASLLEHVPYDSKLHHLFFGEELSMAVRLFTHGYDLYAPPETVCYHLWSRSHRPTNNTIIATTTPQKLTPQEEDDAEKKLEQRRLSLEIVRRQLRGDSSILHAGSSSLGTVRTAAQFAERLGVDFERQTLNEGCQNGGLTANDFCDAQQQQLFPEDSVEAKVASLDLNAQRLIAFFLSGANEAKPPPK